MGKWQELVVVLLQLELLLEVAKTDAAIGAENGRFHWSRER